MKTIRLLAASALSLPLAAVAATCLVSDPLGHSDGTPIAGTFSSASGTTASALDSRPITVEEKDGWKLFDRPATVICVK